MKLTDKEKLNKNSRISVIKKKTMERYSSMDGKSYTVKIQYNKLANNKNNCKDCF